VRRDCDDHGVQREPVKVDLHVHSSHSDAPYSWFLRSGNAAECYTPVDHVYAIAKRRGMDLVTLADHDTIEGALQLCERHPGDTFVSVEISARFPEDGCIVHVIAVDITETQHHELQALRRNVYELVGYLNAERIGHFWCHPLSQVNGRLRREHLERGLLMFGALEIRNGTRDPVHERYLVDVTSRLTPDVLAGWAERHPQTPWMVRDGRYGYVGGSDDHGSLAIARAYTSFVGERSGAGLAAALRAGATEPAGDSGSGTTLAHNCYGVVAGYLHETGQLDLARRAGGGRSLLDGLIDARASEPAPGGMAERLWNGGHLTGPQELMRISAERMLSDSWRSALEGIAGALKEGRLAAAADGVPAVLKAFALELPYLLAHRYIQRDRRGAGQFAAELGAWPRTCSRPRVAVFSDTVDHVNGIAVGLRKLAVESRRAGLDLRLVGCGPVAQPTVDADGVVRLPSVLEHRLAEYPDLVWSVPHMPPLLRFLEEEQIDLVQASTPGPVGIAALAAARLTGLPVVGQYHTDVPEYALHLTGDPAAAAVVRTLVGWVYRAFDHVLVPSEWVGGVVRDLGVMADKIVRVPRGIDLNTYTRARRDPSVFARWGVEGPVLLYVGRLSREKGIEHLLAAFRAVREEAPEARLVLVGDGPLRGELERALPPGCVLTGTITGDDLAALYAGADVFVFPSQTETFGNVVVEAQASGLPAIVADRGATRELVVDGVTGFAVDPRNVDTMRRVLVRLIRDPELRERMGRAATMHAGRYDLVEAARGTFRCYERILAARRPAEPEAARAEELVA